MTNSSFSRILLWLTDIDVSGLVCRLVQNISPGNSPRPCLILRNIESQFCRTWGWWEVWMHCKGRLLGLQRSGLSIHLLTSDSGLTPLAIAWLLSRLFMVRACLSWTSCTYIPTSEDSTSDSIRHFYWSHALFCSCYLLTSSVTEGLFYFCCYRLLDLRLVCKSPNLVSACKSCTVQAKAWGSFVCSKASCLAPSLHVSKEAICSVACPSHLCVNYFAICTTPWLDLLVWLCWFAC